MTRKLTLALFALAILAMSSTSHADRYARSRGDNPLRIVGYAAHGVGMVAEYAVMRPIHWVVSRPHLDVFFGTRPLVREKDTYFEYTHGDYSHGIAEEMNTPERQQQRAQEKARKEAEKQEAAKQKEMQRARQEQQKAEAKAQATSNAEKTTE